MKKIATLSILVRGCLALGLALVFITHPGFRTSASIKASNAVAAKTEAQFKNEASNYERALLAISRISSARLATPEALQQAIEVFKQQRTNINFHRSKLVVRAYSDPTFSAAVKRAANNVKAGERLLKELKADPNAVLKFAGANTLISVLDESRQKDAAILRQAGENLKSASEKIRQSGSDKGASVPTTNGFRIVQAKFSVADQPVKESIPSMLPADPVTIIGIIAVSAALVIATVFIATAIKNLYQNLFTEEGRDAVTECQVQSDERLEVCLRSAGRLDFLAKLAAEGLCFAQWAIDQSGCLIKA